MTALAVVYVLGILTDRVANWVFRYPAEKVRSDAGLTSAAFGHARANAYQSPLRNLFEYNRSRIRVCRGWALVLAADAVGAQGVVWDRLPHDLPRTRIDVTATLGLVATCLVAVAAWKSLVRTEAENLQSQGFFLTDSPADTDTDG